ncbi:hypothetical protein ACI3PF_21990, partial [Lactococcus lactis]
MFNKDSFATIIIKYDEVTEEMEILGKEKSEQLFNYLKQEEFINSVTSSYLIIMVAKLSLLNTPKITPS